MVAHNKYIYIYIYISIVIKIPIQILKSYDFTIQHYENDSNLN